jgi:hypothetical protein
MVVSYAIAVASVAPPRERNGDRAPAKGSPPQALITAPMKVECSGPDGGVVDLDGTPSFDPDALGFGEDVIVSYEWFEDPGRPTETYLGNGARLTATLPIGTHRIGLRVTDAGGLTGRSEVTVVVADGTPPTLRVTMEPALLYPPDHRLVKMTARIDARDACGPVTVTLLSAQSDEPDDAPGLEDGATQRDIRGTMPGAPDRSLRLRAERSERGRGRTYTLVYRATDGAGHATRAVVRVGVPHDREGVAEPLSLRVEENPAGTRVAWPALPGARRYDLVRGDLGSLRMTVEGIDLGAVSCLQTGTAVATVAGREDTARPAPGQAFFYLVACDDGAPGSFGTVSAPGPRSAWAGGCTPGSL